MCREDETAEAGLAEGIAATGAKAGRLAESIFAVGAVATAEPGFSARAEAAFAAPARPMHAFAASLGVPRAERRQVAVWVRVIG